MKILIVTPAPKGSLKGNRITADRWARLLRKLGHRVTVATDYIGQRGDLLIALHARKSHRALRRFRDTCPGAPTVVALTGTDLYRDINIINEARLSLVWATRLVVLQPEGVRELPRTFHEKTRVIFQSVRVPLLRKRRRGAGRFEVCVLGHLRPVKDPFRAAAACRHLPPLSKIRITHVGRALSAAMERRALREQTVNNRYRWLGEVPRTSVFRILAKSDLLVLTSAIEGGANAISEAIAVGIPVISSRIPGSIGFLGRKYPGFFEVGDTRGLAKFLLRSEEDAGFYNRLQQWCQRLRYLVDPQRELASWSTLLSELDETSLNFGSA